MNMESLKPQAESVKEVIKLDPEIEKKYSLKR